MKVRGSAKRLEEERVERERLRHQRATQEAATIELLKERLSDEHGIPRDKKFDQTWTLAWQYGHSAGLNEVEQYFNELAVLIKS
jgi:hypothetical protein